MIQAGDFPIHLMEVRGQGSLSGTGYVIIPYLNHLKVGVHFDNIQVNTDHQLIRGEIITDYDEKEGQVAHADSVWKQLETAAELISDLANLAIDKNYLEYKAIKEQLVEKIKQEELPEASASLFCKPPKPWTQPRKPTTPPKPPPESPAATPEQKAQAKKDIEQAKRTTKPPKKT